MTRRLIWMTAVAIIGALLAVAGGVAVLLLGIVALVVAMSAGFWMPLWLVLALVCFVIAGGLLTMVFGDSSV